MSSALEKFQDRVIHCSKCERLRRYCAKVAKEKRRQYQNEDYWGKPVPSFGDPNAELLIVGLAPAAHGANRTGRMFTGDRSGQWLYRALYKAGFANQMESAHRNDSLELINAWVTAIVHCAPPQNKPSPKERDQCLSFFKDELALLPDVKIILALGQFAWDGIWRILQNSKEEPKVKPRFGHGAKYAFGSYNVLGAYHPSQQNTFTRRLTEEMLDEVFLHAKSLLRGR